jgi:NAD(P)-dependent dehydrogenase (short-subunit alcohol dehydrogenase family)
MDAVERTVKEFGKLDILVNNAAEQHVQEDFTNISAEQLERTYRTNIFSMFYLTKAALKHMKEGASIINTTSITAYKGKQTLVDYSSTKGAITAFTSFGKHTPLGRPGQPDEVAPSFIFLASEIDSSYMTGQVLHPNGGTVVHG